MLIEMKVASLTVDPFNNMPILLLEDSDGRTLPLWIGLVEASAIAAELESIRLDRPMTHDLMKTILGVCAIAVDRVEIHDLRASTFFATLFLKPPPPNRELVAVDARPSDAIALALRARAPIYVAKKVIDKARKRQPELPDLAVVASTPPAASRAPTVNDELLEGLSDTAFGKWKM
jgi:bifunctional DNase/RNase